MINKKFLALIFYFLLLSNFSCKKQEKVNKIEKVNVNSKKRIDYKIEFPDTVYVGELYEGVIKYNSILDTITTNFDDKRYNRYVLFYSTIVDKPFTDYKKIKKLSKNIFGADDNRKIPIYDLRFTKIGTYYIDGIINDCVIMDINKKDKNGKKIVRLIENEERITHKVVVVRKKILM